MCAALPCWAPPPPPRHRFPAAACRAQTPTPQRLATVVYGPLAESRPDLRGSLPTQSAVSRRANNVSARKCGDGSGDGDEIGAGTHRGAGSGSGRRRTGDTCCRGSGRGACSRGARRGADPGCVAPANQSVSDGVADAGRLARGRRGRERLTKRCASRPSSPSRKWRRAAL